MKTTKTPAPDLLATRRAQPVRQARTNPSRSSVPGTRPFGSRTSLNSGLDGDQTIEIFPAITHFADTITALPKELARHFTLLKEVDAKIFAPEEDLGKLIEAAINAPPPERKSQPEQASFANSSGVASAHDSLNGSTNDATEPVADEGDTYNPPNAAWDPANLARRQLFQHCGYTMQNMLISLDEKNHVISTASEALNRQLSRIDDCWPYLELEFSEEARYGSTTHWAYAENRTGKAAGGTSRRDLGSHLSASAQHLVDEAAARSDARKQAVLAKKGRIQHIDSDFDDHHDGKHKESGKKPHGNSKVRKTTDANAVAGLGISNGTTNGNSTKRRKVEKPASGGAAMEKSLSSVFGANGATPKTKTASPRGTPGPDAAKKRNRGNATANGQTRKRNNTITSNAMSPIIASSPPRSAFAEPKTSAPRISPPPTNGGRPTSSRARQNSMSNTDGARRPSSSLADALNGSLAGLPDISEMIIASLRASAEKPLAKELPVASKVPDKSTGATPDPTAVGGGDPETLKKEETEIPSEVSSAIQTTTLVTTKSGRASKPSTPAIPAFPEPLSRSRSSRNALEAASNNKRSHKKGAGAAAQLLAQQSENDDTTSSIPEGEEEDGDVEAGEPTYCYCNGISYGRMVGCDAEGCEKEWFHLDCAGLKVVPKGNAKWYCLDCKEKMQKNKRFSGR